MSEHWFKPRYAVAAIVAGLTAAAFNESSEENIFLGLNSDEALFLVVGVIVYILLPELFKRR